MACMLPICYVNEHSTDLFRQLAPHKEELQSDSQKYMRTIKAKHHEEEVNRRDRKARRRQALAQQQSKLQVLLLTTHLPFSTLC